MNGTDTDEDGIADEWTDTDNDGIDDYDEYLRDSDPLDPDNSSEGDDWIEITPHANRQLTPPLQVGIYAGIDAAAGTCIADFEYFNDLINPFETAVAPKGKLATCWGTIKSD